jgi:[acyl-carrier-protein] S-malonyltransferase
VSDPARIRALLGGADHAFGALARERRLDGGAGRGDFWEIGAGKALSGMVRRIAKEAETRAVLSPEDVAAAAASLRA